MASVKKGQLFTACGDGKIPFISAEDIAAVAFHTLTDEKPHNTSYRVLGPELLTHDDVCFTSNSRPIVLDADDKADCREAQQDSRTQDCECQAYRGREEKGSHRCWHAPELCGFPDVA